MLAAAGNYSDTGNVGEGGITVRPFPSTICITYALTGVRSAARRPDPPTAGGTGHWRGRGAGCRQCSAWGVAGVARAWRGHGAGMPCSPRLLPLVTNRGTGKTWILYTTARSTFQKGDVRFNPRAWASFPPTGRQECTCGVPKTVVGKLDQPPHPPAPSARRCAPGGGGGRRRTRGARALDVVRNPLPQKRCSLCQPATPARRPPAHHLPAAAPRPSPLLTRGPREPSGPCHHGLKSLWRGAEDSFLWRCLC
eukprot:gene22779-biopygen14817